MIDMRYHETNRYSFLLGNNHYVYDYKEDGDILHLFIRSKPHSCKCPSCGQESGKLHATYKRILQDTPIRGKQTYLLYTFLFVDCLYVSVRKEMETKNLAVYVILGYDVNGVKDILGLWIGEAEGKHYWMQIFDEIKARGVEDVLFISMDGVSGLEEGARSIFKDAVVQRCIVHLIRNSIRYIPSKDYKTYTAQLKKVYGASSLKAAEAEFERFKQAWSQYPGAVDVWVRNWQHVEQLFNYGSAVRKVMYTTNSIEAVNSSFRKVTKKGSFPSEDAVRKALYLRITELYKKWKGRPVSNWALVRNQLSMDDKMQSRILKYEDL